ncbi:hypothetical protein J6590_075452 [Homalodisca vitripennis]|nr:hypothetical protein J6590_075452 [Homalodisca vitripennis]
MLYTWHAKDVICTSTRSCTPDAPQHARTRIAPRHMTYNTTALLAAGDILSSCERISVHLAER